MKNEASWDRIVRVVGGVVLIGLGLSVFGAPWNWIAALLGAVLVVTGALGVCPIYAALKIRTDGGGK
jgi:NhaP-type Na+/H+ or K+/H+ antiporter